MSTIQLDFAAKKRFDLSYVDIEGRENKDVYVIHRAPLSTHERFISFLIEHFSGKFPLWIAPVQVVLLTVADRHVAHAEQLRKTLEEKNIRVELDARPESIPKKVRDHQLQKIPYLVTIGDKEVQTQQLAVRTRDNKVTLISQEQFVSRILDKIATKALEE